MWKGGASDDNWTTDANWHGKNIDKNDVAGYNGYYFWGTHEVSGKYGAIAKYLCNFSKVESLGNAYIWVNYTSENQPMVFTASDNKKGATTTSNMNIGWGNDSKHFADGHLKIVRGTYSCLNVQLGKEVANPTTKGWLCLANDDGAVNFTTTGDFRIHNGDFISTNATVNITGYTVLGFKQNSTATMCVSGGNVTISGYLHVGYASGANATYSQYGGNVTASNLKFRNDAGGGTSSLSLNGGTLAVKSVIYGSGSGAADFTFGGGTLRAASGAATAFMPAAPNLTVRVGSGGGTIDTGGNNITIGEDLGAVGDTGAMAFKGGGAVTLDGALNYTGGTTIDVGTVLNISAANKNAILSGLAVALPAETYIPCMYTIVTLSGEDTFASGDESNVAFASGANVPIGAEFRLSDDMKSLVLYVPYSGGGMSTTAQLVFPGVTLADIGTTFFPCARMQGGSFDDKGTEVTFFNRVETIDGDNLTMLTYQLQAIDCAKTPRYVKAAKVSFTNGEGGVYAKLASGNYSNYGTQNNLTVFGTDPLTSNPGTGGYIPYDLRLVKPASRSINVNFTHASKNLDTTSSVRYGGGDYAVPYSSWGNMPGTNGTATVGGATVKVTNALKGSWHCSGLSETKDLRRGFIEDDNSNTTPTITISGIPYTSYRVVVYTASAIENKNFGYVTVNGVNYSGTTDATHEGTAKWGNTGLDLEAKGLREGVNYIVSRVTSGSTATIVGHRVGTDNSVRGNIAAIQIVEVANKYTAIVPAGTNADFLSLAWDGTHPGCDLAKGEFVLNVTGNATVRIPQNLKVAKITFNVAEDATLTLAGGSLKSSTPVVVKGGGVVAFESAPAFVGVTTVALGTCVKVPDADAKDALFGGSITLSLPPTYDGGTYPIATIADGTFDSADTAKVTNLPSGATVGITADGKTLYVTLLASSIDITATAQLVFPGATLADLDTHTLRARMHGDSIGDKGMEATFFNKVKDGTKTTYQLQVMDPDYIKAVKVEFTEGEGGVYAKLASGQYSNYGPQNDLKVFGTDPLTTNSGAGKYVPYDLRLVTAVANSINVNFTHDGYNLDTSSSVRYGGGDYAVPYSSWSNMPGVNGSATINGATVTISGARGSSTCKNLSTTKELRHGYIDDSSTLTTPTITVTDIPYAAYRVVVYAATDYANSKFGCITINGVDYTGITDATVEGTSIWGDTGAAYVAKNLREGVNYLVSPILTGSIASIVGHRTGDASAPSSRGSIAAIQIVEASAPQTQAWTGAAAMSLPWSGENWTPGGTFANGNDAVFATDGAIAQTDSDVNARSLTFSDNATVAAGAGLLTVPSVTVADGKTATVDAPMSGALAKSGAGTLTLGANRAGVTVLKEGTLEMSGTSSLDWGNFTFGTDPAKPVALRFGANATPANVSSPWRIGSVANMTSVVYKTGGDWSRHMYMGCAESAVTEFYHEGGTLALTDTTDIGQNASAVRSYLEISGGMVTNTASYIHLGAQSPAVVTVKAGGKYGMSYDDFGFIVGGRAEGTLNVQGGDVFVNGPLNLSHRTGDSSVCVTENGLLTIHKVLHGQGSDVTTHGKAAISLDGGTLRAYTDETAFIPNVADLTVTIGANGGTIDNNGKAITIAKTMIGEGSLDLAGAGTITFSANQSYTGTTTVKNGTTFAPSSVGVSFAGAFAVEAGGIVAIASPGTETAAITALSFSFANGAKVSMPDVLAAGHYKLFALSSGTFAADAADNLELDCIYPYTLEVEGDTIYLSLGRRYASVENVLTSLTVEDTTELYGAGGVKLSSLSIPADATLVLDPISTPIKVSATPTFAAGAKIALAADYADISLGRIVLMTYPGEATFTQALFDSSSIASGAAYTLAEETAPDGTNKQLVLTVGDYERDAKEIVVTCVGDSITQGVRNTARNDYPQYRTSIAARLAANGYKPKFRGIWCKSNLDAAGVQVPDDWAYHSGFGMAAVRTTPLSGGLADNMPLYLDIAGYPDVITLLIGTNDMGGNNKDAATTFSTWLQLVNDTAAQRPDAKIVGATILQRNDAKNERVVAFNELLRTEYEKPGKGDLPDNFYLLDLYPLAPYSAATYKDGVHPDWASDAQIAKAFYAAIANQCPLATFAGAGDATVTDEGQTALGVAGVAATEEGAGLAAYTNNMVHVFTIEKDGALGATNSFTSAPYTAREMAVPLSRPVKKVGYFMELVRKGTSRRRWVWVDMDATGKTLGDVDFPWDSTMQYKATKLHVKSNYAGIQDVDPLDDTICGIVEGTKFNYSAGKQSGGPLDVEGVPVNLMPSYGWNDTMGTSGGHACFQVHRIFSQAGSDTHWNDAEVLFAWNKWGYDKAGFADNIGIGTYACHVEDVSGGIKTMDYTFTENATDGNFADAITSDAYSVRRLEIWAELDADPGTGVHGKWVGGQGDDRFSYAANWDDGQVPAAGTTLDFSGVGVDTSVSADVADTVYGAILLPAHWITLNGSLHLTTITNALYLGVETGATLTVDEDAVLNNDGGSGNYRYMFWYNKGRIEIGGRFVNESNPSRGGLLYYTGGSTGTVAVKGMTNTVAKAFSLCGNHDTPITWIVGEDGITRSAGALGFTQFESGNGEITLKAGADFTASAPIAVVSSVKFDTTDESGNARTITSTDGLESSGKITIAGSGTFVADSDYSESLTHSGSVTVTDTATLQINGGKVISKGAITVNSGATLKVAESAASAEAAAVTLGGNLSLEGGATLGFNFTERTIAPVLAIESSKTVTANGTIKVAVSGKWPKAGESKKVVLTSGGKFAGKPVELAAGCPTWAQGVAVENGEIVLNVKPMAIMVIVK